MRKQKLRAGWRFEEKPFCSKVNPRDWQAVPISSLRNTTPITTAKMMLVSRNADTSGTGTTVIAQMTVQVDA